MRMSFNKKQSKAKKQKQKQNKTRQNKNTKQTKQNKTGNLVKKGQKHLEKIGKCIVLFFFKSCFSPKDSQACVLDLRR